MQSSSGTATTRYRHPLIHSRCRPKRTCFWLYLAVTVYLLMTQGCAIQIKTPGFEIRAPIPEGWQEVERFTSTKLKMARFQSPSSAEGVTTIQLEHSKMTPGQRREDVYAIEQSIQRTKCKASQTESFSSGEEGGFSTMLFITHCWNPPVQAPLLSMSKYFLAEDQFRVSVDFFSVDRSLTAQDDAVRSWVRRWSTQFREILVCPLDVPTENCGSN